MYIIYVYKYIYAHIYMYVCVYIYIISQPPILKHSDSGPAGTYSNAAASLAILYIWLYYTIIILQYSILLIIITDM